MAIRLMTIDDVPKVMDYVVELTWQDGFHKYFFPGKWEHPFAFRRWWTQYVRNLVLKPGVYVYVLEEDSKILGWVTLVPGDNPPPTGVDLSKSSPRESELKLFSFWSCNAMQSLLFILEPLTHECEKSASGDSTATTIASWRSSAPTAQCEMSGWIIFDRSPCRK